MEILNIPPSKKRWKHRKLGRPLNKEFEGSSFRVLFILYIDIVISYIHRYISYYTSLTPISLRRMDIGSQLHSHYIGLHDFKGPWGVFCLPCFATFLVEGQSAGIGH